MPSDLLVVKLGGAQGVDLAAGCDDLSAALQRRPRPAILVHGVSAEADRLCAAAGHPVRTLTSPAGHTSRYTDPRTRDLFVQAAEAVNREIVTCLRRSGIAATGMTGDDIAIQARRKRALRAVVDGRLRVIRDDHSGTISGIDDERLRALLECGHMPVLPPMAGSRDGLLNIDGDRAAAAVAAALGAADLVILSNVRGLYRDFPREDSFAPLVEGCEREDAMAWAQGRMKRKVLAAGEALDGGVGRVIISDGRVSDPVQRALAGAGTVFQP